MRPSPRTIRVGLLIDRWQPERGGAERALSDLAHHLSSRGHAVEIFASRVERPKDRAPGRLNLVRGGFAFTRGARERRLAEALVSAASRCDVTLGVRHVPRVDVYWPHGGTHAAGVAALHRARAWNSGASASEADAPVDLGGRHRTWLDLERAVLSDAGARSVVCVSTAARDEIARAFPAARPRLALVPNGVDLERFHPRERTTARARLAAIAAVGSKAPILSFAARNPLLKGLPVLFAALARLVDRPWVLVVSGTREVSTWRSRARAAGLPADRLRVVADVDAVTAAAAADLCVLPTWRDTCGLVLLEALAAGTPAITTRAAGASEAVGARAGSVLARPGDVDALAAEVARWLDVVDARAVDHEVVRSHVLDRGREAWLGAIESRLVESAR